MESAPAIAGKAVDRLGKQMDDLPKAGCGSTRAFCIQWLSRYQPLTTVQKCFPLRGRFLVSFIFLFTVALRSAELPHSRHFRAPVAKPLNHATLSAPMGDQRLVPLAAHLPTLCPSDARLLDSRACALRGFLPSCFAQGFVQSYRTHAEAVSRSLYPRRDLRCC